MYVLSLLGKKEIVKKHVKSIETEWKRVLLQLKSSPENYIFPLYFFSIKKFYALFCELGSGK